MMDYRQPDNVALVHEQEAALASNVERIRDLEHHLFAARRALRRKRALEAGPAAGIGALVGNVLAAIAAAFVGDAWLLLLGNGIGLVAGFLFGCIWNPVDDGFPEAPPERLR